MLSETKDINDWFWGYRGRKKEKMKEEEEEWRKRGRKKDKMKEEGEEEVRRWRGRKTEKRKEEGEEKGRRWKGRKRLTIIDDVKMGRCKKIKKQAWYRSNLEWQCRKRPASRRNTIWKHSIRTSTSTFQFFSWAS